MPNGRRSTISMSSRARRWLSSGSFLRGLAEAFDVDSGEADAY
jgi:hypothetical protein